MKVLFFIAFAMALCSSSYGQSRKLFDINESLIEDNSLKKKKNDFKEKTSNFFEDEDYIVNKTCSGEFGGTIKFKNKKTGIEYSCSATCPVIVNKIEDNYIVTNTLAHMSGFSEVLKINNPDSLSIFKLPEPRKKKGKTTIRYIGDDESKSKKGTKQLVDSIGVLTLASFPYKGQLYHIVTDFQKTFLTTIENKRFVTIDLISNESIWTYDPEVIKTVDNHFVIFFSNDKVKGYLDIKENTINLVRYK